MQHNTQVCKRVKRRLLACKCCARLRNQATQAESFTQQPFGSWLVVAANDTRKDRACDAKRLLAEAVVFSCFALPRPSRHAHGNSCVLDE
eukprot:11250573-Alexandrium_andersonii.AAC.1